MRVRVLLGACIFGLLYGAFSEARRQGFSAGTPVSKQVPCDAFIACLPIAGCRQPMRKTKILETSLILLLTFRYLHPSRDQTAVRKEAVPANMSLPHDPLLLAGKSLLLFGICCLLVCCIYKHFVY